MDIFNRKSPPTLNPTMIHLTNAAITEREWLEYLPLNSLPLNYLSQYKSYLSTTQAFLTQITSFVLSILDPQSTVSPSWSTLLLLCVVLYLSLKVLDIIWRAVWFWISFFAKIVFWAGIAGAGLYVWNRGVEGSYGDLEYYARYWMEEYGMWQRQAQLANAFRNGGANRWR
jgi:hypothetical protein